jgi:hypothetical protein
MQALNKQIIRIFIAIALLLPMGAVAQTLTSSVNTYSPYSMYGLGELATPGNVAMRSMGGIGVAMYSQSMVNMLNPAAYGNVARQSFIFNFDTRTITEMTWILNYIPCSTTFRTNLLAHKKALTNIYNTASMTFRASCFIFTTLAITMRAFTISTELNCF